MAGSATVTPPVLARYELKYLIPEWMVEPISEFIAPYTSLDKYSEIADDGFYRINNLYLDTPYYLFMRYRRNRVSRRFNMRIRTYGEPPYNMMFFEVKEKHISVIRKLRGKTDKKGWEAFVADPFKSFQEEEACPTEESNLQYFQRLIQEYNSEPKVQTKYKRKAFFSECDDYARVTFDKSLRYYPQDRYDFSALERNMMPYDFCTNFPPECSVVLELKCYTKYVPLWMIDCIKRFDLKRVSFSKYLFAIFEVLNQYRCSPIFRESQIEFD